MLGSTTDQTPHLFIPLQRESLQAGRQLACNLCLAHASCATGCDQSGHDACALLLEEAGYMPLELAGRLLHLQT